MKPFHDENGSIIYHADMLDVLAGFAPDRFDTVITDPPYHLTTGKQGGSGPASLNPNSPAGRSRVTTGFMGKAWDGGDIAFRPETWQAVLRVCKPGATLLAFGGTRTFHRLACAIEDAGWEIRDCMMWLYGSGFPKSLDISKAIDKAAGAEREVVGKGRGGKTALCDASGLSSGYRPNTYRSEDGSYEITAAATDAAQQWNGWGTALKPAWEPIIVAMKPLDGTFAENAQKWGVAGLHIDAGRIGTNGEVVHLPQSDPANRRGTVGTDMGITDATTEKFRAAQRESIERTNTLGRWPANVVLDEAAAAMLDEQTGEQQSGVAGKRTGQNGVGNWGSGPAVEAWGGYGDAGGASRFFYTAKASKSDRGHGNDHPTVKPIALLKYLCKLTETPTGGEILDPFGGSMTTLIAAREAGRRCVGIDIEESHCRIGRKRLAQGVLFGAA